MATHYNRANIMTLVETTRQRLGFRKGDMFEPTPNIRNPHMMEEAEAFAPQLRAFERAVRDYHRHVQGFLGSLIPMLEENLPRVWTAVSGGLAEPVRPQISHGHPSRIGGDFSAPLILERLEVLNRGMEEDILAPLRRWQEGLGIAKERMKSLEALRRDVDKERRKAEKKFKRHESKLTRAYLGAGYGSSSSSSSDFEDNDYVVPRGRLLEDYQRLALHTERHLNALMDSYRDQERLLWEQLSGLVTDAAWLETYAAATMLKVKETMQAVALALGPCKQPLPAFRHAAYPFEGQYGQIGHNMELIRAMGPRAHELASGAKPAGTDYLPYTPLRAKRGVSTPLMVGAAAGTSSQASRLSMEPVPPVQVGASAIPLEAVPAGMRDTVIRRVEERAMGSGTRVADVPALPPALTPEPAGGRLSPMTPSSGLMTGGRSSGVTSSVTAANGVGYGGSSAVGYGGSSSGLMTGGRGIGSSTMAPTTGTRMVGGTTTAGMTRIPESTTTTSTTTSGQGIISRATEAAGAAVGTVVGTAAAVPRGVAGAARAAAESFREGVAEGEMAGDRDVTRVADTAERARERVADTVSATVAPVTERFSGTHSTTTPNTTGSTVYPTSRTVGSTIEAGRGYDMPAGHPVSATGGTGLSGSTFRTTDLSGMGSPTAAGPMSAGAASPRAGMGMGSALSPSSGSGWESGNQIIAGTAPAEVGMAPMSGGVTGGLGMSEMAGVTGGPGMSERGRTGVSDITGETTGAVALEELHHDDLDMFGSTAKGPLTSHRITDSYDTGLKHHQRAMAAAPAGIDESTYSTSQVPDDYSREGRDYSREGGMVGEQRQGGGGLLGAVKRAVGV